MKSVVVVVVVVFSSLLVSFLMCSVARFVYKLRVVTAATAAC